MIILAKQKREDTKLFIKEFENVPEAAHYLKVSPSTVYHSTGRYGRKPFRVKGWYVDFVEDLFRRPK